VAKLPTEGPNRQAASTGGAYLREADAYRSLLPRSPIRSPEAYAVLVEGSTAAFLLEDLTPLRRVDQMDGLSGADAITVVAALARFHRFWTAELDRPGSILDRHEVRRSALSTIKHPALVEGLAIVRRRWPEVTPEQVDGFARLVAKAPELTAIFGAAGRSSAGGQATLCHGDPRADNLFFAADNTPVLFDWQQIAVQFPEADLAWLAATSLDPESRRRCDHDLVSSGDGDPDRYRLGFVLPGMAALMLAQRDAADPRAEQTILSSLQRIGTALVDFDVGAIAR